MLASQEEGLPSETVKFTAKSGNISGSDGADSSPTLLKDSPLLPQLNAYCDQRMAVLSAPPERLAAIEQVQRQKMHQIYARIIESLIKCRLNLSSSCVALRLHLCAVDDKHVCAYAFSVISSQVRADVEARLCTNYRFEKEIRRHGGAVIKRERPSVIIFLSWTLPIILISLRALFYNWSH